jgi:small-conductance mechanosensitive channel
MREARDASLLVPAAGKSIVATIVLCGLLWILLRVYGWARDSFRRAFQRRAGRLVPGGLDSGIASHLGLGELAVVPVKVFGWALALLLVYQWAVYVFALFPYTRPWSEALLRNLLRLLGHFGSGLLGILPGLASVALIFIVTRWVVRGMRSVFAAIADGRLKVAMLDGTTAPPTGRLLAAVIWLFALVAAYPYLPGSGSEAFKGIGVFVGLMLSIGASGIVNQAVSGMMLMYTRALRPGEFVQIGEVEGTVQSVGYLTTRLQTLRQEQINLPNSLVASSVTRNYSRLSADGGLRVATKVTIGYDVPWRQVHAMLVMAARRVPEVNAEPAPRVLQTGLQDFYPEYTLVVSIAQPSRRIFVLSEVNAAIQDVFNEYGVQIMSPNYEADTAAAKVVPREDWFKAPASADAPRESAARVADAPPPL